MTVLVGVVSLSASRMTDKAQAEKIVSTVEDLRGPITLYHQHTGELPREFSGFQGASYHRLSQNPSVSGWAGPYIKNPIRRSWNPTGGQVHLYDRIPAAFAGGNGFDLDGDGKTDVKADGGCVITYGEVSKAVAQKVDKALDEKLPGTWSDAGRVEYRETSRRLTVLLLNP